MKRMIAYGVIVAIVVLIIFSCQSRASESAEPVLVPVKITGYCLHGTMANGEQTHPGVCAYKKEDIGKYAILYDSEMNFIGQYEIADTGKKGGAIRKGLAVDVWFDTKEECYAFTNTGYIQVIDAEG